MRNQKGITLIALVITIIVLLILAGVSIAMLTGNNGILTQATNAKKETANAEAEERINMELQALKGKVLAGGTLTEADKTAMQTNLGEGYTVEFDNATGITVKKVPTGVSLTTLGKIDMSGNVTPAVAATTSN